MKHRKRALLLSGISIESLNLGKTLTSAFLAGGKTSLGALIDLIDASGGKLDTWTVDGKHLTSKQVKAVENAVKASEYVEQWWKDQWEWELPDELTTPASVASSTPDVRPSPTVQPEAPPPLLLVRGLTPPAWRDFFEGLNPFSR